VDATLRPTSDLRKLNRDLRAAADGRQLRKELTQSWRGILRPIAREVQAAYRAAPSRGHASRSFRSRNTPGIRASLARATRVEVRTAGKLAGARVRVDGRKMPPRLGSVPAMWEGPPEGERWRHPVYGDRDTWVSQPSRPTFYRITRGHEAAAWRAADDALDDVGRKLERGTI
jgi:hypothetical protein